MKHAIFISDIQIGTYIHTHIHTYIHTYIHIPIVVSKVPYIREIREIKNIAI